MSSVVPEGWEVKRLGELCNSVRGVSYKPDDLYSIKSDSTATLLRSNNIQSGQLIFNNVQFVDRRKVKERQIVRTGDIAICMSNGSKRLVGKNGIFPQTHQSDILTVGAFCSIIRTKEGGNETFISQVLKSDEFFKQVEFSLAGSAINNLKDGDVEDYLFSFPPLSEQKKIASILTSVDEVIENTQKQIDKLQDLKKATMNELLTKGIGHTEFKDSELGRIPKSWEVKKLGVFAKVKGGKRLPKGEQFSETMTEYPYIRVSDFENQGINKTRLKYVSGSVRESIKRYVISSKDLYISIAGSIGIIGTIPDELSESLLTENAAKIVLESNVITRDFLKCNLSSEIAQSQFRQEKGTGGGVPKLALFRIEETVVALPKIDEQLQISSTIASLDKAISDMDSKLSQTQSLKKSLMQDLLTGKVRVTVN
jgi:type I restriction enzyme S subunit